MIEYKTDKIFTADQAQDLFRSVGWVSADYPSRLYKALQHSETVVTAWDGNQLVGLARAIDDSELVAFIHYVLVRPSHQGLGIAGSMVEMIKDIYKDYLYIEGMPEDQNNVPFYQKHGFVRMENGAAIQICNYSGKY